MKDTKLIYRFLLAIIIALPILSANMLAGGPINSDNPTIKIVGGKDADVKDYPWQVAIFGADKDGNITEQMCGGSIIDEFWILTAAHCIMPNSHRTQKIVAQITKLSDASEGQIMEIAQVIIHPDYNEETVSNDIALIRLAMPLNLAVDGAKSIRIVTPDEEDAGMIAPGKMATITGWGTTEYMGNSPDILQVGELPIISVETANQWFQETNTAEVPVLPSMLPAAFEKGGVSGCHGDSGGPLAVKDDEGNWVLGGITSWGNICGGEKQPAVYTRVPYYYDWILDNSDLGNSNEPTKPDYLELVSMEIPDKVYVCGDIDYVGDILVRNFGTNPLSSLKMTVKIGTSASTISDMITETINFSTPLPTRASARIEIPASLLPAEFGLYYIEVSLEMPNGMDVELSDNVASKYFEYLEPNPIKIKLEFGDMMYAQWVIATPGSFEPIASGQYTSANSNSTEEEEICLPEGEYTFFFMSMGDAMCELSFDFEDKEYVVFRTNSESFPNFCTFSIPFEPINDLSIFSFFEMISDTIFICDLNSLINENMTITFINNGTLPAEDIKYRIILNGIEEEDTIEGILYPGNSANIELDPTLIVNGQNTVSIQIISYNGGVEDATPNNNYSEGRVSIVQLDKSAELEIRPDANFWNFSWSITDMNGNYMMSENVSTSETYSTDICLPEGCYYFIPEDWYDEGMSTDTAAIMRKANGDILFAVRGEDFHSGKPVEFCLVASSVRDVAIEELRVFPNPASYAVFLSVVSEGNSDAKIEVSDLLGNKLITLNKDIKLGDNFFGIDISNLSNGVYFVRINTNGNTTTKKFTVSR